MRIDFASVLNRFFPVPTPDLPSAIRSTTAAMLREAEKDRTIGILSDALAEAAAMEKLRIRNDFDHDAEMKEALAMGGAGPWRMPGAAHGPNGIATLRESSPLLSTQGAYGDIELALQNVEWRREVNMSWLEFSRWGIQQIILISRLYSIKNPMILRGINVSALYVFGRGVEVTTTDPDANQVLQDFFHRNKRALGQTALVELEKRKYYDGNLFFVFFADKTNTGEVNVRTVDATEISDIVTDPDDSATPQLYRRDWIQREFDTSTGAFRNVSRAAWYPALDYEAEVKPATIGAVPVMWDTPIYHRKCGGVAKWKWGLPLVYAALDWAKAARRFLENCMTIRDALAQFAMTLTTKGGQAAQQGAKQQLSTTVGPSSSLLDKNPPAVAGSIFTSGPGSKIEAFKTTGAGGDPAEVREYKLMVAMVFGIPESFFADMNTSNLATATSLDRPTELNFMEKQEAWREDLSIIAQFVLKVSAGAVNSKFREALEMRHSGADKGKAGGFRIFEAARVRDSKGRMVYEEESKPKDGEIKVMVNFPAIIEADVPAQVSAIVEAMTLGNKAGEVIGIDEKEGVRLLNQMVGVRDSEEILEAQYPEADYDPDRTKEPDSAAALDPATGLPVKPAAADPVKEAKAEVTGMRNALARLGRAVRMWEARIEDE